MNYIAANGMANKKILTGMSAVILVMLCAGNLHAQQPLLLNNAIAQASRLIENRLNTKTRMAILDFSSDSEKLSDYIIDKLSEALVNDMFIVIERQRRDLIRKEIEIQYSGDVDDDYMAKIGKQCGAQNSIQTRRKVFQKRLRWRRELPR